VRTRVLELDGAGAQLLLLHGYSDCADSWRPLLRALASRGRRALAADLPGFGEADRLAGYADRFAAGPMLPVLDRFTSALVRAAVETSGVRPVIVGNSLGSVAGLRAAQEPELPLAGVVAISPAGLGHQPWVALMEREPVVHRVLTARLPLPGPVIRWAARVAYLRLAVADATRVDRGVAVAYAAQYRHQAHLARVIRDARRLLVELRTAYDLARICHPVELVWGARDLLTPSRGARRVLDAVPDAGLVVLERCGHCAHVEQPERVAEIAVAFADRAAAMEVAA
jgi:pimeloyl-ACP methyl ester carboxylesterase